MMKMKSEVKMVQVDLSGNLYKDNKGNIYNKYGKLVFKI